MIIRYKIAHKNTCWWSNLKRRQRMDTIIGIHRTWCRADKVYIWSLTIGRFKIGVIF
jgi:hypothetical protein